MSLGTPTFFPPLSKVFHLFYSRTCMFCMFFCPKLLVRLGRQTDFCKMLTFLLPPHQSSFLCCTYCSIILEFETLLQFIVSYYFLSSLKLFPPNKQKKLMERAIETSSFSSLPPKLSVLNIKSKDSK